MAYNSVLGFRVSCKTLSSTPRGVQLAGNERKGQQDDPCQPSSFVLYCRGTCKTKALNSLNFFFNLKLTLPQPTLNRTPYISNPQS